MADVIFAEHIAEASGQPGEIRAGGTDIQARRRFGISRGDLVDIQRITELRAIQWDEAGAATVGALVTLHQLAADTAFATAYPGVAQAAAGLATPQIRHMATLGGAVLQRTRCWYYRQPYLSCFKRGGTGCPAREGHNPNGVVFDLGPCVYPHPSTMGMALLAYAATVGVHGQATRPLADLYGDGSDPAHDHTLPKGAVLTHVVLPPPLADERTAYFRAIARAEAEWPTVECLARLVVRDGQIAMARVAVGGVANIPLRLEQVEAALVGRGVSADTFTAAAGAAAAGAQPLPQTGYKVVLLQRAVLETLERAAARG